MSKDELRIAVNAEPAAPGTLRRVIVAWKNAGASQQAVYELCDAVRLELEQSNDAALGRLLELMDIVGGYCAPRNRIWETQLV